MWYGDKIVCASMYKHYIRKIILCMLMIMSISLYNSDINLFISEQIFKVLYGKCLTLSNSFSTSDFKILQIYAMQLSQSLPLSRVGSLLCHTCGDMKPQFLRSCPKGHAIF